MYATIGTLCKIKSTLLNEEQAYLNDSRRSELARGHCLEFLKND